MHTQDNETGKEGALRREFIVGRNPVLALVKSGREIDTLYISQGQNKGSIVQIIALCEERGVPIKRVNDLKLDALSCGAAHQGVAAALSAHSYAELEDIFTKAGEEPVFIVIADELEDPHNLGAIIRTAEAAGAHGIICPKRRSATLTPVVAKVAAGALESLPVVRVVNLVATIKELKERGVWVFAADMAGECYCQQNLQGPIALIIGSEGGGVGRLVLENCDGRLGLPMYGAVNSLNASVAAGVLLYEIARQRNHIKAV